MNDGYKKKSGSPDVEKFCEVLHESDVAVAAIADYFTLDSYFSVREKYYEMYTSDRKLLLPNLELRLSTSVNKDGQSINLHLVFRDTLTRQQANKFLSRLKTTGTAGRSKKIVTCAELTPTDYASASVSMDAIDDAIRATFGEHAVVPEQRREHLIIIASAKGDGIRPGGSSLERKKLITDEVDKYSDAFYGNAGSRDYFLKVDRLEVDESIEPKPVIDGCDAHNFADLTATLGKAVHKNGKQTSITWIKADPSFAGLLQILIEPEARVAMQPDEPDVKEPYRVIERVKFSGTSDFPAEIVFNRNLNAIIGSRSSGKSALLAFLAHAVDAESTVQSQMAAHDLREPAEAGPAAGYTWSSVKDITCEVRWESGDDTVGRVIYIPQNSLNRLSQRPEEITLKIAPALFRSFPDVKTCFDANMAKVSSLNSDLKNFIERWFTRAAQIDAERDRVKGLGDYVAIGAERDRLQEQVDTMKSAVDLTNEEVAQYQAVSQDLDDKKKRIEEFRADLQRLSTYVSGPSENGTFEAASGAVEVKVAIRPSPADVPSSVGQAIEGIIEQTKNELTEKVRNALEHAARGMADGVEEMSAEISAVEDVNSRLIAKHRSHGELSKLIDKHKKQVARLTDIERGKASIAKLENENASLAQQIKECIDARMQALKELVSLFEESDRSLGEMTFGIECEVKVEDVESVSRGISQRAVNRYLKSKGDNVDFELARRDPGDFLESLQLGRIKINKGFTDLSVASDVLGLTEDIRFSAALDGDRIGGFGLSSMTPGKQALFALTLILDESDEPWPLLIDQPEDDLDSRSIYDTIVPYLTKAKKHRQIIMVSHNANLVIGADAEEVLVANRHGEDRKNVDQKTFDYLTGSLEDSRGPVKSASALGKWGIREHACEILDGGEEAFRKRRDKYKIREMS